jgi:hypothetical protein
MIKMGLLNYHARDAQQDNLSTVYVAFIQTTELNRMNYQDITW